MADAGGYWWLKTRLCLWSCLRGMFWLCVYLYGWCRLRVNAAASGGCRRVRCYPEAQPRGGSHECCLQPRPELGREEVPRIQATEPVL